MIYFVTPAHRRFALSAVCFEQRRRMIDELASRGIEAQCVVVADDDNLDLAQAAGFDVIERDNRWLGRKFNDGIEHARQQGADWIVPVGSDDWLSAELFLPAPTRPTCSRRYAAVEHDRILLLDLELGPARMYPADALPVRPADDLLRRGVDRSILEAAGDPKWDRRDVHPLQYVGFRGERHITTYAKLHRAWGGLERLDPWAALAECYPVDLVERAQLAMKDVRRPLSFGRLDIWSVRDRVLRTWDRVNR